MNPFTQKLALLLVFFGATDASIAQDIHFSQFYACPLLLNPANAGIEHPLDASIIYRQQWKSVADPFTTYGFSVSGNTRKDNKKLKKKGYWGLGLDCYYDKSGDAALVSMQSGLSLSYHVKLNTASVLSAGVKGVFNQKSINNTNFRWGSQYNGYDYDASILSGESLQSLQRLSFFDLAAGINYLIQNNEKNLSANNQKTLSIGIAGFHLNRTNAAMLDGFSSPMNSRYILHASANIGIPNSNVSILPKGYFQIQGGHREGMAGMLFSFKNKEESKVTGYVPARFFTLGLLYRVKDAFTAVMQYEIKNYMIGIGYDINASKLTTASKGRGAFEVTLRYINRTHFLRKGAHKGYGRFL